MHASVLARSLTSIMCVVLFTLVNNARKRFYKSLTSIMRVVLFTLVNNARKRLNESLTLINRVVLFTRYFTASHANVSLHHEPFNTQIRNMLHPFANIYAYGKPTARRYGMCFAAVVREAFPAAVCRALNAPHWGAAPA